MKAEGVVFRMNRYTRISTRFWDSRSLSDNEKLLFLYTLTSPHSNTIGFYVLPKLYIMHDLGWSRQRLAKPFNKLLQVGFIKYCNKTSVILIPNFLKHNPIQNKNQAVAAVKSFKKYQTVYCMMILVNVLNDMPNRLLGCSLNTY
jgi:hypothetical protein